MSVKIKAVAKQLPEYSRDTTDVIPLLDLWLEGQDERFIRKVKKIFEGAAVDKRYSIMDPVEVFTSASFEEKMTSTRVKLSCSEKKSCKRH
jgi:hypothetical protein